MGPLVIRLTNPSTPKVFNAETSCSPFSSNCFCDNSFKLSTGSFSRFDDGSLYLSLYSLFAKSISNSLIDCSSSIIISFSSSLALILSIPSSIVVVSILISLIARISILDSSSYETSVTKFLSFLLYPLIFNIFCFIYIIKSYIDQLKIPRSNRRNAIGNKK